VKNQSVHSTSGFTKTTYEFSSTVLGGETVGEWSFDNNSGPEYKKFFSTANGVKMKYLSQATSYDWEWMSPEGTTMYGGFGTTANEEFDPRGGGLGIENPYSGGGGYGGGGNYGDAQYYDRCAWGALSIPCGMADRLLAVQDRVDRDIEKRTGKRSRHLAFEPKSQAPASKGKKTPGAKKTTTTTKPENDKTKGSTVAPASVPSSSGGVPPTLKYPSDEETAARKAAAEAAMREDPSVFDENDPVETKANLTLSAPGDDFIIGSKEEFRKAVVDFFKVYGQKFRRCVWEVFGTDWTGEKSNVATVMPTPSSVIFPYDKVNLADSARGNQGFHQAGLMGLKNAYGPVPMHDGSIVSGRESFFRTLAHEYANYLSWSYSGDGSTFGTRDGIAGDASAGAGVRSAQIDRDTGARMEKCMWGNVSY
jgi:hypothetical protein